MEILNVDVDKFVNFMAEHGELSILVIIILS